MKKVFLIASMMMLIAVSAQQRPQSQKNSKNKEQRQRPSVDNQLKEFEQYNLTSTQKKKVKSLLESRNSQIKKSFEKGKKQQNGMNDFDTKLEKILDKNQYKKYKQNRTEHARSKDYSMRGKNYLNDQRRSKKSA